MAKKYMRQHRRSLGWYINPLNWIRRSRGNTAHETSSPASEHHQTHFDAGDNTPAQPEPAANENHTPIITPVTPNIDAETSNDQPNISANAENNARTRTYNAIANTLGTEAANVYAQSAAQARSQGREAQRIHAHRWADRLRRAHAQASASPEDNVPQTSPEDIPLSTDNPLSAIERAVAAHNQTASRPLQTQGTNNPNKIHIGHDGNDFMKISITPDHSGQMRYSFSHLAGRGVHHTIIGDPGSQSTVNELQKAVNEMALMTFGSEQHIGRTTPTIETAEANDDQSGPVPVQETEQNTPETGEENIAPPPEEPRPPEL